MMSNIEPIAYKHDYCGQCASDEQDGSGIGFGMITFSLGIFQWLPMVGSKKLKKSPVKFRIKGLRTNYKMVYAMTHVIIKEFDTKTFDRQYKSMSV